MESEVEGEGGQLRWMVLKWVGNEVNRVELHRTFDMLDFGGCGVKVL
jgi:hypothetical protein